MSNKKGERDLESLGSIHRYPLVCKELSLILRGAYRKVPKNLQSLIFQDTVTAFRLLPEMKTRSAVSAAHLLLQSVEATLPKQKKNLAVTEYKNAMIAHKRRAKARQEENVAHLPQDILVHVFSFLDFQSLVSVGQVCWPWNFAASDKGESLDVCLAGSFVLLPSAFKYKLINSYHCISAWISGNNSSKKLKSSRGYCRYCKTIVWLDNMKCFNDHIGLNPEIQKIDPVSPSQVVDYLLEDSISVKSSSESDSDSDSEAGSFSRLWAYRRPLTSTEGMPFP
ncbi:F-box protein At5g52880-like [Rosa rugosa]|uniref:F-box protein At5g52880-like n=1 Tax=Rosa rugosa TaxID=74645 RepID=UPI002B4145B2|nr:F-box protein At5g52880-like [Rosa rugosa]